MQNNQQYHDIVSTESRISTEDHNNYYYNTHATGRFLTPEQGEAIKQAYLDNISDQMTGAVASMIESAFKNGLEAEEIVMAIEETGFAPRPSPAYLRRILENWVISGVTVSKIRHEHSVNRALPWWK